MKTCPKGWRPVKLKDVVIRVNDLWPDRSKWDFQRYVAGEHFEVGGIAINNYGKIKGNEKVIGSAFQWKFQPGDVLYLTRNPRLRKAGIVNFEGICSSSTFVLRTIGSELLQEVLPFLLQTENFVFHACNHAHGSTNPFLNWKDIAKYELCLPPLEEQKKISILLWSIEDHVVKLKELIHVVKELKKQALVQLLTKGIGHTIFKETVLGKIPEEWSIVKLKDVAVRFISGGTPSTKNPSYWNGDIPWIRSAWIKEKFITKGEKYITKLGLDNSASNIVKKDNLLIATRVSIGNVGINKIDVAISQDITGIIIDKSKVMEDYLYLVLFFLREKMLSFTQGSTIKGITRENLMNFEIPCPDIYEQQAITNLIESIDKVLSVHYNHEKKLIDLKKSLMNNLLTGKKQTKM